MKQYQYKNGQLHQPDWMVATESQKDGPGSILFFSFQEAEKEYYKLQKYGGVKSPQKIEKPLSYDCSDAAKSVMQDGGVYYLGEHFNLEEEYLVDGNWVRTKNRPPFAISVRTIADVTFVMNENEDTFTAGSVKWTFDEGLSNKNYDAWCAPYFCRDNSRVVVYLSERLKDMSVHCFSEKVGSGYIKINEQDFNILSADAGLHRLIKPGFHTKGLLIADYFCRLFCHQ